MPGDSLRVAFLTPEYAATGTPDGGLANYVRKTAHALVERGHEAAVFTLANDDRTWCDDGVDVLAIARRDSVVRPVARIPIVGRLDRMAAQLVDLRALATQFWAAHDARPFDIIHAASYAAPGTLLVGNERVPVVCRLSSHSPTLRAAYGRRTHLEDRIGDFLETRLARGADACFAPSQLVARRFEKLVGRPVDVLRSPVEPPMGTPDRSMFERYRPAGEYLLFFGTLSPIKGVDLLAIALPHVLDHHPGLSVLFIGRDDGAPDGSTMWSQIESGCGSRARYLPTMKREQLEPFIANAIGVLLPSRIDNYPNACLEAQALGIPVVGTHESTLDEMIEDGATGFLARNGDARDIESAIERLLALSPAQRKAMGALIREANNAVMHEDRIDQLIGLYRRTIAEFRQAHG